MENKAFMYWVRTIILIVVKEPDLRYKNDTVVLKLFVTKVYGSKYIVVGSKYVTVCHSKSYDCTCMAKCSVLSGGYTYSNCPFGCNRLKHGLNYN